MPKGEISAATSSGYPDLDSFYPYWPDNVKMAVGAADVLMYRRTYQATGKVTKAAGDMYNVLPSLVRSATSGAYMAWFLI